VSGLMGTGKSVLARALAPLIGAQIIQTDSVRKEMLRIPATEHHYEDFGQGIYSAELSKKTYEKALELALDKLETDRAVIIDASYKSRQERLRAYETGLRAGADAFVLECICPEDIVEKRLNSRRAAGKDISDGRWEIFLSQRKVFERIDEIPERHHLVADTSLEAEDNAVVVLRKMLGLG
jgi:uncharacterized protein